jgi:hypothetical protein
MYMLSSAPEESLYAFSQSFVPSGTNTTTGGVTVDYSKTWIPVLDVTWSPTASITLSYTWSADGLPYESGSFTSGVPSPGPTTSFGISAPLAPSITTYLTASLEINA